MQKQPSAAIAIGCYVIYLVIVIGAMMATNTDYLNMTGPDVVFGSIVFPLALGAVFLVVAITWLGWWEPVMRDRNLASPTWLKWPLILLALSFSLMLMSDTDWFSIAATQLMWLIVGSILVGFNEEALTRGVVVVGLRDGKRAETAILLISCLLFGMLHLPNALIGMPLWAAGVQVIFAAMMGAAFYVIRRTSGLLLIPMILHGLWDFSTFSHGASGVETAAWQQPLQLTAYAVAVISALVLMIKMRGHHPQADG